MANGLLDGLGAYWALEESGGSDRLDSHTGGHDLTETGTINAVTGVVGNGAGMSSISSNKLHIVSPPALFLPGSASFSVACWAKFNLGQVGLNHPHIAVWDSSAAPDTDLSWLFWQRTSQAQFLVSSDGATIDATAASAVIADDAAWRHYAAGYDAGSGIIWVSVNAGTKTTVAHTLGTYASSIADLSVGWFKGSAHVGGSQDLDEVGFWTRVLTDDDLAFLYNSGSGNGYSTFDSATPAGVDGASYYLYHGRI